jgi:hypothetical protein
MEIGGAIMEDHSSKLLKWLKINIKW